MKFHNLQVSGHSRNRCDIVSSSCKHIKHINRHSKSLVMKFSHVINHPKVINERKVIILGQPQSIHKWFYNFTILVFDNLLTWSSFLLMWNQLKFVSPITKCPVSLIYELCDFVTSDCSYSNDTCLWIFPARGPSQFEFSIATIVVHFLSLSKSLQLDELHVLEKGS